MKRMIFLLACFQFLCLAKNAGHVPEYENASFWESHDIALAKVEKVEALEDRSRIKLAYTVVFSDKLVAKTEFTFTTRDVILIHRYNASGAVDNEVELMEGDECVVSIAKNADVFTYIEEVPAGSARDSLIASLPSIVELREEHFSPASIDHVLSMPLKNEAVNYLLLFLIQEKRSDLTRENVSFLDAFRDDSRVRVDLRILESNYEFMIRTSKRESYYEWLKKSIKKCHEENRGEASGLESELISSGESRERIFDFMASRFEDGGMSDRLRAVTAFSLSTAPLYNYKSSDDLISKKILTLLISASEKPKNKFRMEICMALSQVAWKTIQNSSSLEFAESIKRKVMDAMEKAIQVETNNDVREDLRDELNEVKSFKK